MAPYHTMLFPTDFSDASKAMAVEVRAMAVRAGADVTVMHSFNVAPLYYLTGYDPGAGVAPLPVPYTPWASDLRTEAEARLESFAREYFEGIRYRTEMANGEPAVTIHRAVERLGVDLIAMPTSGTGKFRRLVMGSVTAKVLHDVSCPILTSAHEPPPATPRPTGFRAIVCAVEWNQEAEAILRAAEAWALFWGAGVSIVHMTHRHLKPEAAEAAEVKERQLNDLVRRIGVAERVRVLHADVAEGIRRAVIEDEADLVVIGRGKERGRISRLRSQVYEIVQEAPCPVLSI
jgi:nucleotide-binding universal stress UspA family protein